MMMANLVFGVLVALALHVTAHACPSGRMFVGSVDESFLDLVQMNGVYLEQDYFHDGRQVFRHEQYDIYLYYVVVKDTGSDDTGESVSSGFWVIGPDTSGANLGMRVSSVAELPEMITERWEVRTGEGSWAPVRRFRAVCVKDTFAACSSGRIVIGGLNQRTRRFLSLMGSYELTDVTYELRPVYRHTKRDNTFLYFLNGMWLIGAEVGLLSGYMFVVDNAFRPEYIVHSWIVPFEVQFTQDHGVRVVCEGHRSPANQPSCTEENACSGKGRCISTGANFYVCDCKPGYFGHDCDKEVSCGSLPAVRKGRIGPSTGESLFDLAFYSCNEGYAPAGALAAVCQPDGNWSDLRKCRPNYFHVTPIAP